MAKGTDEKSIKHKIIDTAGDVFGRMGYKAATIREICKAAGVNVAAVNYHFGGKKELYRTVVTELISRTFNLYPLDEGVDGRSDPERRLRAFVRGTLMRLIAPGGLSGYPGKGQLVARELADPSIFLNDMVDEFIRPAAAVLSGIIADMLGPDATFQDIMRCQISVIGQCFHYAMARPIVSRLTAMDFSDASLVDDLADHITRFSIAGIEASRCSISGPDATAVPSSSHNGGEK